MYFECKTPWTTSFDTTTFRLPWVFGDELRRKNKNSPTHSGTSAAAFSFVLVFQLFFVQEANAGHHPLNLGGQSYQAQPKALPRDLNWQYLLENCQML